MPLIEQHVEARRREETAFRAVKPRVSSPPEIPYNRWIWREQINGCGLPCKLVDQGSDNYRIERQINDQDLIALESGQGTAEIELPYADGRFSDAPLVVGSETGIDGRVWADRGPVIGVRSGTPMDRECKPANIYYRGCKRFEFWPFGC